MRGNVRQVGRIAYQKDQRQQHEHQHCHQPKIVQIGDELRLLVDDTLEALQSFQIVDIPVVGHGQMPQPVIVEADVFDEDRARVARAVGQLRDENGDPVAFDGVRTLVPRGAQLPDPTAVALPWNLAADGSITTPANAVIRVEALAGVDTLALAITLAGHPYPSAFADEEDVA